MTIENVNNQSHRLSRCLLFIYYCTSRFGCYHGSWAKLLYRELQSSWTKTSDCRGKVAFPLVKLILCSREVHLVVWECFPDVSYDDQQTKWREFRIVHFITYHTLQALGSRNFTNLAVSLGTSPKQVVVVRKFSKPLPVVLFALH